MAETFDMEVGDSDVKSLKGVAALDNCVTVLDAAELHINMTSIMSLKVVKRELTACQPGFPVDFAIRVLRKAKPLTLSCVQDKKQAVSEEDDRNVAELLLDQIEFADVILLNKQDLVPDSKHRQALLAAIKALNPEAKVQFTTKCKVKRELACRLHVCTQCPCACCILPLSSASKN